MQRLVDVGVGLELEALVGPSGDADADERILLPALISSIIVPCSSICSNPPSFFIMQ